MKRPVSQILSWIGLLALAGCGSGSGSIPFISTVVVVNTTDSFTVTLVGFDYDSTVDQVWRCNSPQANVTLGTSMFGGSVHIVIEDDAGTVVYDNFHSGSIGGITVQTAPGGVPGDWRVILDFDDASWAGAITFNADNPPTPDAISIGSGIGTSDSYLFFAEWDATTVPVHVSIASGLSSGTLRLRIWDPAAPPASPTYEININAGTGAVSDDILTGGPGTWMIQIDFNGAVVGGALSISN